jgi:hypothetical protein
MLSTIGKALLIRTYAAILYLAALSYAVEFFKLFNLTRAHEFLWAGIWVAIPLVANMGRFSGWLGKSTEFGVISAGLLALPWIGLQNAPYWLVLLTLFATIQLFLRGSVVSVWKSSLADIPRRIEGQLARERLSSLTSARVRMSFALLR